MKLLTVRRVALGSLLALICATSTHASIVAVTGAGNLSSSRTTPTASGILADGQWLGDALRVTWRIVFDSIDMEWDYYYNVEVTQGSPGLSHYILELTHFVEGVDQAGVGVGLPLPPPLGGELGGGGAEREPRREDGGEHARRDGADDDEDEGQGIDGHVSACGCRRRTAW